MACCNCCFDFNAAALSDNFDRFHFWQLCRSAENGCASCGILKVAINRLVLPESTDLLAKYHTFSGLRWVGRPGLLDCRLSTGEVHPIHIYRVFGAPCPEEWQSAFPAVSKDPLWIQNRIKECAESHETCPKFDEHPLLPTRILDLGSSFDSSTLEAPVKVLINTDNKRGRYIALSHRWGKPSSMKVKLTTLTFSKYQQRIDYFELPKTFQDAVKIARMLKFQYLWIDSLCIIQRIDPSQECVESSRDWKLESSKMCSVYENSFLTIAACCATDSNSGIFFNPSVVNIEGHSTEDHNKGIYRFVARRSEGIAHNPTQIPLLTRGWVIQEFLLSPRLLLYTDEEMVWQCRTDAICQCIGSILHGVEDVGEIRSNHAITPWKPWIKARGGLSASTRITKDEVLDIWLPIVQQYSATSLAYASDRLVAIDGIAQSLRQRGAGGYQYGLWSESLIAQLSWHRLPNLKSKPRVVFGEGDSRTEFPSWSWASCPAEVAFFLNGVQRDGSFLMSQVSKVVSRPQADKEANSLQNTSREICLEGVLVPTTLAELLTPKDLSLLEDLKLSSDDTLYRFGMLQSPISYLSLVLRPLPDDKEGNVFQRVGVIYARSGPAEQEGKTVQIVLV